MSKPQVPVRILLLLPAVLLGACSHPHYLIRLRDGGEIIADGKPEYVVKTGYYRYRAINGKDALVRGDEVLHLQEQ